ncbi:MAG: hypothetical protein K2G86_02640 [Prevotella sp.]|nr:hypothetical protein [Prevotella sp.]
MATVAEKLAESLELLKQLQDKENFVVLQGTKQLSRVHLTRLLNEGWLKEVLKGWYIASRPGNEHHACNGWLFMDNYPGRKTEFLYASLRKGERRGRYQRLYNIDCRFAQDNGYRMKKPTGCEKGV